MQRALGAASFFIMVGLGFFVWRVLAPAEVELAAAPAAVAALAASDTPPASAPPLRVLFVGNSHTYVNDMPLLVQNLAAAAGDRPLAYETIAYGGARISDHVANGKAAAALSSGGFHVLVLQEQQQLPSWSAEQRQREMIAPAQVLSLNAQAHGAKTILTMVWARKAGDPSNAPNDTYAAMHARSVRGHVEAAQQISAALAPASIAWQSAMERKAELELWQPDGSHPALAGSYLAACVMYQALYAKNAIGNTFTADLPDADAALLQEIAATTRPPS
jgi:hypothetical protein